jgi:hypothetical protein
MSNLGGGLAFLGRAAFMASPSVKSSVMAGTGGFSSPNVLFSSIQNQKQTNRKTTNNLFNTLSFPEMKGTLVVLLWTDCDSFVHGAPLLEDKNNFKKIIIRRYKQKALVESPCK